MDKELKLADDCKCDVCGCNPCTSECKCEACGDCH